MPTNELPDTPRLGPAAVSLRDRGALAREMVQHFKQTVAQCLTLPDDVLRGDITAVTVNCLRIATTILDGRDTPTHDDVAQLEAAGARWARQGIPVDVILHALHEGSKMAHELVTTQATVTTIGECVDLGARTIAMLDLMNTTVTMAYLREYRSVAGQHHTAAHTLTTALLSGHATTAMAREAGLAVAETYHVLALSLPPHPSEHGGGIDYGVAGRRKLRRVQSALALHAGPEALSLLSSRGGTILLPATDVTEDALIPVVKALAAAAEVPITAVADTAAAAALPAKATALHEMLDIAHRLHDALSAQPATRLYRFAELAAEYQVTRPGPARDILAAKLAPLVDQPLLMNTLCLYILVDNHRRRVARRLHVHPNTIDHRLKRIATLTGLDPTCPDGRWKLRAALIAGTFLTRTPPRAGIEAPAIPR